MQAHHSWFMVSIFRIVRVSGISAAAEHKQSIIFILTKVKQRLAGKTILKQGISMRSTKRLLNTLLILGELILFDDIKNLEKVMVGVTSTLDYTALWLVHKRMLKTAEIASKTKIHDYLSKLSGYISKLNFALDFNYSHFLVRQYNQRRAQRGAD